MPKARKLTPEIIDDFFEKHIPSRLAGITSYVDYTLQVKKLPPPAGERIAWALNFSAIAMCRMLLEFLGIVYDGKGNLIEKDLIERTGPKSYRNYDVHVEELGGRFVKETDLSGAEQATLKRFLHMANKVAHFTYDFRVEDGGVDGHLDIAETVRMTVKLLDSHLYLPTGRRKIEVR